MMKSFLAGVAGALLTLLAVLIISPFYSDYRSRSESANWLTFIMPARDAITERIQQRQTVSGSGLGIAPPVLPGHLPALLEITPDGMIIMQGGHDGQLLVLIPSYTQGQVIWRCLGGSAQAVPKACGNDTP